MSHARFQPRRILAALAAGTALSAAGALPGEASPGEEIVLQRTPSGHLVLPVTIGGDGPFPFILDTGATHTAIASSLAERFGYAPEWQQVDDVQALTTRFEAERFALDALEVAGQAPVDLVSVIIPVEPGQPTPIAGLLGADAILSSRYRMDLSAGRLSFDVAGLEHVDGQLDPTGLLVGEATMLRASGPVHVMLDSGSARTIANIPLERRIGNRHMVMRSMTIGGIDGRETEEASLLAIRQFRMGGLCFPGLRVLHSDLDIFRHLGWEHEPAMVIGMDLLRHATITIDREAGVFQIDAAIPDYACERDN